MTRGRAHPDELRAQVCAAVLAGTSISEVARQYGLDKGLVSKWAKSGVALVATEKRSEVELIREYLQAGLLAMISQAEVMSDPEYCRSQDADKLAIAHGVLGDKLAILARTAQTLGLIRPPLPGSSPDDGNGTRVETAGLPEATG